MTALEVAETTVRGAAIGLAFVAVIGSARATVMRMATGAGETSGLTGHFRAHRVYLIGAVPYFTCCALLWRDLGVSIGNGGRLVLLVIGTVLGGTGAGLYLAGRHQLGPMYNVSSALGCELYDDQRLVTHGLYRYVRHPMYLGLLTAAVGALCVFRTWTFVFVLGAFPLIVIKARREERLLAEHFGSSWDDYADRVPGWLPRRPSNKEVNRVERIPA